jgi:hypothetical protein
LGDGVIAGEFSGAGDVQHRLARPSIAICVEFAKPLIRIEIGLRWCLILASPIAISTPTNAEPINPADVHVIDGYLYRYLTD